MIASSLVKLKVISKDDSMPLGLGEDIRELAQEMAEELDAKYERLPSDSDGRVWTMTDMKFADSFGNVHFLQRMSIERDGTWKLWAADDHVPYNADTCSHVAEDEYERILRVFLNEVGEYVELWHEEVPREVIEECAKQLRGVQ